MEQKKINTHEKVAIVMGSNSDRNLVEPAIKQLSDFEIEFEIFIISAHRSPNLAINFAKTAKDKNFKVIIAAASLSAHLAGVLASHTILPVIGIPLKNSLSLADGLDALFSTVQMPPGVVVATVAINNAKNAAVLAAQILAISNKTLADKLNKFKIQMEQNLIKQNSNLD